MPHDWSLEQWSPLDFQRELPRLVEIYRRAFLDHYEPRPDLAAQERHRHMSTHTTRPGFRALAARSGTGGVVGFCYAGTGRDGQWWHDVVVGALGPELARRWMRGCAEVVELHVEPEHQQQGIGRAMLRELLAASTEPTAVLSAIDEDTPAMRLYLSEGFEPVLRGFRFPGNEPVYAVLVKDLRA